MVKKSKKGKVEQIMWRDSNIYNAQEDKDFDFKVAIFCSVGYVVRETKDSIILAGDVLDNGDVRRVIVIPKENIL